MGLFHIELNSSNKNIIKSRLDFFKNNFDGDFYIELQRHNKNYQKILEKHLIELAYKYELPLVATNDVCFLEPEMQNAHEVLMCIEAGLTISNPERKVISPNHYFKNMNEMIDLFNDIPEAISKYRTYQEDAILDLKHLSQCFLLMRLYLGKMRKKN